ncbi:hypothetical protein LCGC14_2762170, partial [marine sediment metagenome]
MVKQTNNDQVLRFSPYAWAKAIYYLQNADTEVSMMGISAENDYLFIENVFLVEQKCTKAHTEFDDEAYNNYIYDMCALKGMEMQRVGRIWIHTHPSFGAAPSGTDNATLRDIFGGCDWAVRVILGKISDKKEVDYDCTLQIKNPAMHIPLEVTVDWDCDFPKSDAKQWKEELDEQVTHVIIPAVVHTNG